VSILNAIRVASVVYSLEQKGFDITRYNLANDSAKYAENEKINQILHEKGPDALPVIVANLFLANSIT
jgi:hypothetical protein